MDKATRNIIQRATQDARRLLETEFSEQLEGTFDILPSGKIADAPGAHLDDVQKLTRTKLVSAIEHKRAAGMEPAEAVAAYLREAAFTCLNRFVALKMLEARELVQECISRGENSAGFREFTGLAPGLAQLSDHGYRLYIECLFDEIGTEVGVLFDRRDSASLLWPRRQALTDLLDTLNADDLAGVWEQDETIGWVYQYFNGQEERRAMREASQTPRNSRELAVRNQFFTPRYVVQFLTDNTIGRIWYEMRQGDTRLVNQCEYLVRRPNEIFLGDRWHDWDNVDDGVKAARNADFSQLPAEPSWHDIQCLALAVDGYALCKAKGWKDPQELAWEGIQAFLSGQHWRGSSLGLWVRLFGAQRGYRAMDSPIPDEQMEAVKALYASLREALMADTGDLSQEELLSLPVFMPHRPKKDPRDIRILDPACGSGHFLLYTFDLLIAIYEEGWADKTAPVAEATGRTLREDYADLGALRQAMPGLILRHNLHGIDIDARCAQIAALALWMRAQRASSDFGLSREDRPAIRKTNVVVAEPMPGEKEMLREFNAGLSPPLLGQLVEVVFENMKLAGEAGSLLKIEEEIAAVIAAARRQWADETAKARDRKGRELLFTKADMHRVDGRPVERQLFDLSGIDDDTFWQEAEGRIYEALWHYSEQATNGKSFSRRLFAEDAQRGFAFIDLCRQNYDVALTNPPFGTFAEAARDYAACNYAGCKEDIDAAFVARTSELLGTHGRMGAIVNRTQFFKPTLSTWRHETLLTRNCLSAAADLGHGVLDGALVEAAAYTLQRGPHTADSVVFRLLKAKERDGALLDTVQAFVTGAPDQETFAVSAQQFATFPEHRIAYWAGPSIRRAFLNLARLSGEVAVVKQGLVTADDFRFCRLTWEVPAEQVGTGRGDSEAKQACSWVPFAKGGEYAPYFADIHLVVAWADGGAEHQAFGRGRVQNEGFYFRPGITWSVRTASGFSPRVLPAGCIFSHTGDIVWVEDLDESLALLGMLMSRTVAYMIEMMVASGDAVVSGTAARSYEVGVVGSLPIPVLSRDIVQQLSVHVRRVWQLRLTLNACDEMSRFFYLPTCVEIAVTGHASSLMAAIKAGYERREESNLEVLRLTHVIEGMTRSLFALDHVAEREIRDEFGPHPCDLPRRGVGAQELEKLSRQFRMSTGDLISEEVERSGGSRAVTKKCYFADRDLELLSTSMARHPETIVCARRHHLGVPKAFVEAETRALLSYGFGCAVGRWTHSPDVGLCEREPFDPIPSMPPAASETGQAQPIGIMVDDMGHDTDVLGRIRTAIHGIWQADTEDIVREAVDVLDPPNAEAGNLRPWFRKNFFDDHMKRYSKSRRKGPIYWELATPSHGYAVWLYYHRFTGDTFYKVLNDYVKPKLGHEQGKLTSLAQEFGANPTASQRKELATQEAFVEELRTFAEEIERIAPLWNPDLNDGVIINFAPLWRLVPQHRAWQKECKACWDKLVAGDYDWAHLAMHLWPERVVPKCHTDRSLAIAHDLEDQFWERYEDKKGKEKWRSREDIDQATIDQLIAERTNPTVKAAFQSLLDAPAPWGGTGPRSSRGRRKQ